jgi:hypothetical protein
MRSIDLLGGGDTICNSLIYWIVIVVDIVVVVVVVAVEGWFPSLVVCCQCDHI